MPDPHPDRPRPLERQGQGLRCRRRRLRRQAVPHGGGAGAHPRSAAPRRRPRLERARLRDGAARHPREPRLRRRQPGQADLARIPPSILPDAPRRPRGLAQRDRRPSLRPGFRSRFEHDRGLRRTPASQARRRHHPDDARPRLSGECRSGGRRRRRQSRRPPRRPRARTPSDRPGRHVGRSAPAFDRDAALHFGRRVQRRDPSDRRHDPHGRLPRLERGRLRRAPRRLSSRARRRSRRRQHRGDDQAPPRSASSPIRSSS